MSDVSSSRPLPSNSMDHLRPAVAGAAGTTWSTWHARRSTTRSGIGPPRLPGARAKVLVSKAAMDSFEASRNVEPTAGLIRSRVVSYLREHAPADKRHLANDDEYVASKVRATQRLASNLI